MSYSRSDTSVAIKIATQLRNEGADIWIDRLDIPPGNTWDLEIEKALEECSYVLFICSQGSVSSENVLNEVYYALEEKKKIVPIKIDDCKIPFRIKRLQYIDLSINYDEGFGFLLSAFDLNTDRVEHKSNDERFNQKGAEENFWKQTSQTNTIESYQNYVKRFPLGMHSNAAIRTIKEYEAEREEKLWSETKSKNTVAAFKNYLKETRLKNHADGALKILSELDKQNIDPKEDECWKKAKQVNSIASYEGYLKKYSNGNFKNAALSGIKTLRAGRQQNKVPSQQAVHPDNTNKVNKQKASLQTSLYIGAGSLIFIVALYFFISYIGNETVLDSDLDPAYYVKGIEYRDNKDYPAALEEFRKSAALGHTGAMYEIGKIYSSGEAGIVNKDSAFRYYQDAARGNNALAMLELGYYYMTDTTEPKYDSLSFVWFLKAAKAGNKAAMTEVSVRYHSGLNGIEEDHVEGNYWQKKAEAPGN